VHGAAEELEEDGVQKESCAARIAPQTDGAREATGF
jgi:hypothetical protein